VLKTLFVILLFSLLMNAHSHVDREVEDSWLELS